MTTLSGIGAWLLAVLHLNSHRQDEISVALKHAHEETCEAVKRNMEESKRTLMSPAGRAQTSMDKLLYKVQKRRGRRHGKAHL